MKALSKIYLDTCGTPKPPSKGIMLLEKYVDESMEEKPASRDNNCYFRAHYKLHVTDADVPEDGWDLKRLEAELDLWVQSTYYKNEGFFTVKLMSYANSF